MTTGLARRLVPDDLWCRTAPLLPSFMSRPQGGGTAPVPERTVFTAVVFVVTSGCAWRKLPAAFGVSPATAHRRFAAWTDAGLWERLRAVGQWGAAGCGLEEWVSVIVQAAEERAGGERN
ncbi:transposase [Streptomyces sp. TR06-5]|uniref:transposase n=1 Tax=unclassified Streptomyces TaxID=2593676 RepID=UPI0039A12334